MCPSRALSAPQLISNSKLPPEIDVSDVQFTISTTCILDADEFFVDSDIVKFCGFRRYDWDTNCIPKLTKVGDDGDCEMG
jgi:hypothetical protein